MRITTTLLLLLAYASGEKVAVVYLVDPTGSNNATGTVTFKKGDDGITVSGTITGLPPGNHGFHIHNLGNIYPDCTESGPHFNPENQTHGAPNETVRHVGDLGNIVALDDGIAHVNIVDTVIDLEGMHNIIGRAVVVHQDSDDLGKGGNEASLITGNAGARIACGVIGILQEDVPSSAVYTSNYIVYNILILISLYGLKALF